MSELIRAPEGVAAGIQDLISRGLLESDDLSYAIDASDRLAPHARLDIYASMYFFPKRKNAWATHTSTT